MTVRPKLELESGETSLEVRRVSVVERISDLFTVDVVARSPDADLDIAAIVGKGAAMGAEAELGTIAWSGVCNHMEQIKPAAEATGRSSYLMRIVPSMWLLTQRRGHRIFQHISTPDLVKQILGEYSIDPKLTISETHPKHEYRVQYGETDYAFVARLLEEAGITFYFDAEVSGGSAKSILTLCDAPQHAPSVGPIDYYDTPNDGQIGGCFMTDVHLAHGVRPGTATYRDFDFRKPRLVLRDSSEFPLAKGEKVEDPYEHYVYAPGLSLIEVDSADDPQDVADDKSFARHVQEENKRRAGMRAEALRYGKRKVDYRTNHPELTAGAIFSIDNHPRPQLASDKKLLVIESNIHISELEWTVLGTAVFAEVPYRPEIRTEKPRVAGVQTAMVVGPPGQEIYTDEYGRVRVRFHWDREGAFDDNATCWLRVSQAWAGTGFGSMLIPRVGHEVIVDFFDGDPDQPMVVGRLFNETTRVPRKLPDHKTQSIWRSASSPQTDGHFNEIMLEDNAGKELYFVQAQRDLLTLTKHDHTERTGEDRTAVVGEARVAAVGWSDSLQVGKQHLAKMVTINDLKIPKMGDPDVSPLDTWVEMVDQRITLTTGEATILLDGGDITIDAKGGLRFTTDGRLIIKGSKVLMNISSGQASGSADKAVSDKVAKPDRMIGSVAKLFWESQVAKLSRTEQTITFGVGDMPELVKGDTATGKYLTGEPFVDGASPKDVVQGAIGDCYLPAAMASCAHVCPEVIERAVTKRDDGKVTVMFKRGSQDVPVVVDTEVPMRGSSPLYAKSSQAGETWPALMEKAYAEQYGMGKGYEGIGHGGSPGTAMTNITGGTSRSTPVRSSDATSPGRRKALLDTLSQATSKPTTAITPKPPEGQHAVASGRVAGWHAYSVLGTSKSADGKDMVKLRNPWGGTGGTKGEFEMPLEHFAEDYSSLNQVTLLA
jgi:type VI secretion system secreted protein VgrG